MMIPEDDPFYLALKLIDSQFHTRWQNHASLINFINESNDYSYDMFLQNMLKRSIISKIIVLGFAKENLTPEDVSDFFLKHYSPKFDRASEICNKIHENFRDKFIFTQEQMNTLIDLIFFIPDHITRKSYLDIQKLVNSIASKKQELYKYHCLAYVKETFERMNVKPYSKSYRFLDISKRTWEDWKNSVVRNKKNIDRFNEWKSATPKSAIVELTPLLEKFLDYPDKDIKSYPQIPSCFIKLLKVYKK